MATERFTVIALPLSVAADAEFHVSLFVAPHLVPDGGNGELGDFSLFPAWPTTLAGATIELRNQGVVFACTPLLDVLQPDAWEAAFPPDTPVKAPTMPDLRNRQWRTFRAAEVQKYGKVLHMASMLASTTSPPKPSKHPLGRLLGTMNVDGIRATHVSSDPGIAVRRGDFRAYDESVVTRMLDAQVENGESLAVIERSLDGTENVLQRMALHLHRVRRFYERPEAAVAYRERPLENADPDRFKPPRPEPDFHQRCALVGDHPAVLRRLGLVIDVRVDDPALLRSNELLSARILVPGAEDAGRSPQTQYQMVGDDLVVVGSGPDWRDGRLRLGSTDDFELVDVDADGTALKSERLLHTLPRLAMVEANGDPVDAAPAALRSTGFTVVRNRRALGTQSRLERQEALRDELEQGGAPVLGAEDVTRGMRVEVWDDSVKQWFSLHSRMVDVEVLGRQAPLLRDVREEGFIQGAAAHETGGVENGPVHLHESLFGWDGWSLSVARPGRRVRHVNGDEVVEDTDVDPDPVTPIVVDARVAPGTLPRLRYGRLYAFRAWAVDLAGNSPPHILGGPLTSPPSSAVREAVSAVLGAPGPRALALDLIAPLREETRVLLREAMPTEAVVAEPATRFTLFRDEVLDRITRGRLRRRGRGREEPVIGVGDGLGVDRAALVRRAVRAVVDDDAQPFVLDTAVVDVDRMAGIVAAAGEEPAADVLDVVTPLRPFLRWDPVVAPAVVARRQYTEGESLRQVVIRSAVDQDPDTLALTVTGPAATSERHLAPPKTSQIQAELHGMFDPAVGSTRRADHRKQLHIARREAGSFFDLDVPRLGNADVRDPQPGVALAFDPSVPTSERASLPLPLGKAPGPGQYVVHDTNKLRLPYLPDPLAQGISLVFPEAGRDRNIPFPFGTEGFTARYPGAWPAWQPFRLVLAGGETLAGALKGHVLRIELPPGDVQRFRLASSLDRTQLPLLGPWRSMAPALQVDEDMIEAAAGGWLWALTPFEDVTLVHAVSRPLEAPRPVFLRPERNEGSTEVVLEGAVDIHGPSTDSITAEATWVDRVDDLTLPADEERPQRGIAFTTTIRPEEDLAILWPEDSTDEVPDIGTVHLHAAVHRFGDTRHRVVDYRFRATTRFREYFPPVVGDDERSVVGPVARVSVPSSARPAAPIVHSVIPLFRWDETTEPEQPVAVRRRRRAGVRIYLERPWWSSGDGELLGVLVAPMPELEAVLPTGVDVGIEPYVSQWGGDPVWLSAPVVNRALFLELADFMHVAGYDDRPADAGPVVPPATLPLAALPTRPTVTVLGYRPTFSPERNMWYVDVAVDARDAFWPFVRLVVARYQPSSIEGCHLSAPVRCPYVQLTPDRTTTVSRPDVRHVRVVVSGPVGVREHRSEAFPTEVGELAAAVGITRQVVARLQRRDPAIPTDLGWETVASSPLTVRGTGATVNEAAWVGTVALPDNLPDLPLERPGKNDDWRVTVEEWERLPGDPAVGLVGAEGRKPVWERRLVYADEVTL